MTRSSPPQAGRSVAVGLFQTKAQADAAAQELRQRGRQISLLGSTTSTDLTASLTQLGVPDGEARFYASEVKEGRILLVADAKQDYVGVREVLLRLGGQDVQAQGAELARSYGAGDSRGAPRPIDVTGRWEDVRSRYEMLFGQHYGTTDASWEQMEPVYRWAWEQSNNQEQRGKPWSEVEGALRGAWRGAQQWDDAKGPVRDVWEDVADEATTGAEGGQDRRIPRQGTDQRVAARDVLPPEGVA